MKWAMWPRGYRASVEQPMKLMKFKEFSAKVETTIRKVKQTNDWEDVRNDLLAMLFDAFAYGRQEAIDDACDTLNTLKGEGLGGLTEPRIAVGK